MLAFVISIVLLHIKGHLDFEGEEIGVKSREEVDNKFLTKTILGDFLNCKMTEFEDRKRKMSYCNKGIFLFKSLNLKVINSYRQN